MSHEFCSASESAIDSVFGTNSLPVAAISELSNQGFVVDFTKFLETQPYQNSELNGILHGNSTFS